MHENYIRTTVKNESNVSSSALSHVSHNAISETLDVCVAALRKAETYLVERGIEYSGTVGRTEILPAIRKALSRFDSMVGRGTTL